MSNIAIIGLIKKTDYDKNSGFIKPIYEKKDENFRKVGDMDAAKEKYPNRGTIFIQQNFRNLTERFEEEEFICVEIEESRNYMDYLPNSCKYQSLDGDDSSVRKLPLIIKDPFALKTKTVHLPFVGHQFVFIEDREFIYGPISISEINANEPKVKEDEFNESESYLYSYQFQPLNTSYLKISQDYTNVIFKFKKEECERFIVNNYYGIEKYKDFISDLNEFVFSMIYNPSYEIHELNETDEQIIYWGKKINWEQNSINSIEPNSINKIRLDRYKNLKNKSDQWNSYVNTLIKDHYLQSTEGINAVASIVETSKERFLKPYVEELQIEAKSKISELNNEIKEKQEGIEKLKNDISKLNSEKIKLEDSNKLVRDKNKDLNELEVKLSETVKKYGIAECKLPHI